MIITKPISRLARNTADVLKYLCMLTNADFEVVRKMRPTSSCCPFKLILPPLPAAQPASWLCAVPLPCALRPCGLPAL
ncbi:hypothetical protein D5272_07670 [bacterium D16-76]|nr:hypothetical protein [bacterium D16-76]